MPHKKLFEVLGDDLTQDQAFAHANKVLKNAVGGISDFIHMHGLDNVDFEAVKTVMSEPGEAKMSTATAVGPDRATKAAEAAVACPLFEGIDLSGARRAGADRGQQVQLQVEREQGGDQYHPQMPLNTAESSRSRPHQPRSGR